MTPTKLNENEIRYIHSCNVAEYEESFSQREANELLIILEGIVFCTINGAKRLMTQGDVVLFRAGDECKFLSRDVSDTKVCAIAFGDNVIEAFSDYMVGSFFDNYRSNSLPPIVSLRGIQRNKTARDMLVPATEGKFDDVAFLRLTAANVIYDCFVSRTEIPEWVETPPDWFIEYYIMLSRHYIFTKPFNEIVFLAGKSREYISRLFKSATGKNISEHVIDLRVNHACNLLKNSNMDVMGISFECGFENLSTFYHHFSSRMGMPPKRYRMLNNRS